jgi:hypothetical protein
MRCEEDDFYLFLKPLFDNYIGFYRGQEATHGKTNEEVCKEIIYSMCGISSRSELDSDKNAANEFHLPSQRTGCGIMHHRACPRYNYLPHTD